SGVHAKTIVIDGQVVYEGSLNWASQTASYEHMWRFESKEMASLVERMLQLRAVTAPFSQEDEKPACPHCKAPLLVVNQAQPFRPGADRQALKFGCSAYAADKHSCRGFLRGVDLRLPFKTIPKCTQGKRMQLFRTSKGRPWAWRCEHKTCREIRWVK